MCEEGMDITIATLVIMVIIIVLFALHWTPPAITAMLGALMMIVVGAISPADFCNSFGSYICILLASTGVISAAVFETGLAHQIGRLLCRWKVVTGNEKRFLIICILSAGVASMFVANIPVFALFMQIIAATAVASRGRITRKRLIMAIGFASVVGGSGSLIGSSINLTGLASLQATTGDSLSMFTMLPVALGLLVVMALYYLFLGDTLQKRWFNFEESTDVPVQFVPFSPVKGAVVGIIFLLMMVGFMLGLWNLGIVALLAALACVLTGCIPWKKALEKIDWSTIVLMAGTFSIATGMNQSGAGTAIAMALLRVCGGESASPLLLLVLAVVSSSFLSCLMSNNAVVAILIPVFCTIAQHIGSVPVTFAIAIICSVNICFATPISTTPITMSMAVGYRFKDYVKVGGILTIISDIAAVLLILFFFEL